MSRPAPDDAPLDDVDRLFLKIEPLAPPADFAARVAAQIYPAPEAAGRRRLLWWAVDALALLALLALSVSFGMALHDSGSVDILAVMLEVGAVGDVVEALLESLPWLQLAALALNAALVVIFSKLALGADAPDLPTAPRPRAA
ncbi:MAG TPA: hypothetical protein VG370_07695 [Chloroflexota bacterium]|jgi:hypothetical protein|nr:hypothetical protein [Chloroflexota bacterium]